MRWIMRATAFTVAVGALVGAVSLAPLQRRLTYFPTQSIQNASVALPGAEDAQFDTDDGLTLDGWFLPGMGVGATTVIVFNGNGGNRGDRVPLAKALSSRGYGVLLFDYRGYGGNPGRPTEDGLLADGRAAVAYLESRGDIDQTRIVYFGESLGAAIAIATARHRSPAVLVLRSPFTSLPDVASVHYPVLPMSLLLADRYPNERIIGDVDAPILVVAGSGDRTVPFSQSERVFQAARDPKRLVIITGADHNDESLSFGPELLDEVAAFIESSIGSDS
jgi:fermentation-respiration switch protein FrsA (DUF1100 family)